MNVRLSRGTLALLIGLIAITSSACTHVKPWERGKLAHPTMTGGNGPSAAEEHVYAVHEGAVGGGGSAESGCGCN
jgi:hypothetical protein